MCSRYDLYRTLACCRYCQDFKRFLRESRTAVRNCTVTQQFVGSEVKRIFGLKYQMYCEYRSTAGSISEFDDAHILQVLTMLGVLHALLCRFCPFLLQAYGCQILRVLSRIRSTRGFCFGDSASQNLPAIFPPFQYWFYWNYVVTRVRFNAMITDGRSLEVTNQPDRFIGGNGEGEGTPASSLNYARFWLQQQHSSCLLYTSPSPRDQA